MVRSPVARHQCEPSIPVGRFWPALHLDILARWRNLLAAMPLAFAAALFLPSVAVASDVEFGGTVSYTFNDTTARLTADRIQNFDTSGSSGSLRLELWAATSPYSGGTFTGYKLAQASLGILPYNNYYSMVDIDGIAFNPPPDGTWIFILFVTEYTGSVLNDGYSIDDWVNFAMPVVIGNPPPP